MGKDVLKSLKKNNRFVKIIGYVMYPLLALANIGIMFLYQEDARKIPIYYLIQLIHLASVALCIVYFIKLRKSIKELDGIIKAIEEQNQDSE